MYNSIKMEEGEYFVRILEIESLTHDVYRFHVEKPGGYSFIPGQATDVSINKAELRKLTRPFSFTSLNSDPFLEFSIKFYLYRKRFTNELSKLNPGDELIIRDPFGAIKYNGKGVFIAGGAGITPFISIFRDLTTRNEIEGNVLLFANKTKTDIILEKELKTMLGNNFINILSEENTEGYLYGFITEDLLKSVSGDLNTKFYLCGPPPMMQSVLKILAGMGVLKETITIEM